MFGTTKINYYIDDELGVTAATIEDADEKIKYTVFKRLLNTMRSNIPEGDQGKDNIDALFANRIVAIAADKIGLPRKLVGKSRCNLEVDEYDYHVGMRIARMRVTCKYSRHIARLWIEVLKYIQNTYYAVRKVTDDRVYEYRNRLIDVENIPMWDFKPNPDISLDGLEYLNQRMDATEDDEYNSLPDSEWR